MHLKESKTITLHDVSLKEIYDKLLSVLKEAEVAGEGKAFLGCFPQLPHATRTRMWTIENRRNPDSVQS